METKLPSGRGSSALPYVDNYIEKDPQIKAEVMRLLRDEILIMKKEDQANGGQLRFPMPPLPTNPRIEKIHQELSQQKEQQASTNYQHLEMMEKGVLEQTNFDLMNKYGPALQKLHLTEVRKLDEQVQSHTKKCEEMLQNINQARMKSQQVYAEKEARLKQEYNELVSRLPALREACKKLEHSG
eukprot:g2687.t1